MSHSLKDQLGTMENEHIRSNIERIISSYRHVWDIYTELLQNSADAIYDKFGDKDIANGKITLKVLPEQRLIIIEDNGVGINEDDISKILVNGKSIKRELNSGKYGFMGFGFTYIAFQSETLIIQSTKNGKMASRTYSNLYNFIYSNGQIPNSFEEENNFKSHDVVAESGTKIIIKFPNKFPDNTIEQNLQAAFRIANHTETFTSVLRTKTIVGSLDTIFGPSPTFSFQLFVNNAPVEIQTGYLTVRELVGKVLHSDDLFYDMPSGYEPIINITEKMPVVAQDQARKAILIDCKLCNVKIGDRNQLDARFYITSTSKSHINSFNENFLYDKEEYDYQVEHGVWLAICGMPIGVCLDTFDHSNYLPFTILVDVLDSSIRKELDAGRKGISPYRMKQIADKAKELLVIHNFIKYRRYVVGGADNRIADPLYDPKKDLTDRMANKKFIGGDHIQKYLPPYEEQEVISLFIELMCKNVIIGYSLKILSGYAVYDGLFEYCLSNTPESLFTKENPRGIAKQVFDQRGILKKDDVFIEFKTKLKSIYKDLETNKKDLSQIDVLVCWDVEFESKDALLKEKGDVLKERNLTDNVYFGVTHQLIGSNRQQPLQIIELKTIYTQLGLI